MSTNNDNRNYDRDQDQQSNERNQNQNQHQSSHQDQRGDRNTDEQRDNSRNTSSRDIESKWTDIESDYRKRYTNLTDQDLNYRDWDFDNMTDRIAQRTNRSRDEVNDEIKNWKN
ncbi:hypothetical protein [Gelidibacter salicanalis]|uniref:CsbD family protein n=1 Tax=Gelidibacter salicanalis TaxID=291193 RepID=A0A934NBU8_9FLAO|nr:hypothetical protein [Gelidibacter salicanalis]MBJ7880035.1 hypothetical protein [Gelidibacter salicanalis]